MAELKTKVTNQSVEKFLKSIPDEQRRKDCFTVLEMMKQATGSEPRMWGTSIVGLGDFRYRAGSKENEWFMMGFSPRKQNLTLYLMCGLAKHAALMKKLGKHKTGNGCLYLSKLEDVDLSVLQKMIEASTSFTDKNSPGR
jgi:Domain of unknown function (DU1801)